MLFEWDPEKARENIWKHKVSFDEAVTLFFDPLSATFGDLDHSKREERYITIGFSSKGRVVVVSHTDRGKSVRLISARLATPNERKKHEGKS